MSPLCWAGGQWLRLSRSEMLDYDVDPDEGREWPEDDTTCRECGEREKCECGEEEA